jgi:hypothetical protein
MEAPLSRWLYPKDKGLQAQNGIQNKAMNFKTPWPYGQ